MTGVVWIFALVTAAWQVVTGGLLVLFVRFSDLPSVRLIRIIFLIWLSDLAFSSVIVWSSCGCIGGRWFIR